MKTKPLDIVYNKAAFTKVKEIFSRKTLYASRKTELNIAGMYIIVFVYVFVCVYCFENTYIEV